MTPSQKEAEEFGEDLFYQALARMPRSDFEAIIAEAERKSRSTPRVSTPRPAKRHAFSWTFFLAAVGMVLFVMFNAAYEGARIGFLAEDASVVARIENGARRVESLLLDDGRDGVENRASWRKRALAGEASARRGLGLLCLCGRGGVEIPTDDITLSRFWSLFGFSFYFGLGMFGYYVLRPFFKACQASGHRIFGSLMCMILLPVAFYLPGLIVFHFSRQWYPALSSWMTGLVAGLL